jgi:hypothetical protein
MSEFPEWIQVGAQVAIVMSGNRWGAPAFRMATVDRLTATQIVVGDRKFKPSKGQPEDIREVGAASSYYRKDFLLAASNPLLGEWREAARLQGLKNEAHKAVEHWLRSRDETERAQVAVDALLAFIAARTT